MQLLMHLLCIILQTVNSLVDVMCIVRVVLLRVILYSCTYVPHMFSVKAWAGGAATVLCADDLGGNKTRNGRIMMSRNIIFRDDDDD